eukprot:CAMPEP_0202960156 /NCGR_PEP_ID=MMETSP1396-20130829/4302_1 /ASSEMBLY_ACC=CAM_ASM_000872 /TAXON_ID= /ORGANISM="Pseudokeronopsis sp., Strain Brazil" /LENGTH=56 /DNA_ID=CAMNT_0049679173 /DNA_START=9 /DNA_END=179 /DNA_ORIENTATION=+
MSALDNHDEALQEIAPSLEDGVEKANPQDESYNGNSLKQSHENEKFSDMEESQEGM